MLDAGLRASRRTGGGTDEVEQLSITPDPGRRLAVPLVPVGTGGS